MPELNPNPHPRIATSDIVLCKTDGRRRWGLEVVGTIKTGTRFIFTPGYITNGQGGGFSGFVDLGLTPLGAAINGLVGAEVANDILAKSVEKADDCFADLACRRGHSSRQAEEVLDQLLKTGIVKIDDVKAAMVELFGPADE